MNDSFSREAQPSSCNFGFGILDFGFEREYFAILAISEIPSTMPLLYPKSEIPIPKSTGVSTRLRLAAKRNSENETA
jgi:hypothetical protein